MYGESLNPKILITLPFKMQDRFYIHSLDKFCVSTEKVLRKLMDRIKSQRQEWMSKSLQETGDPYSKLDQESMDGHMMSEKESPGIVFAHFQLKV